MGLETLLGAGAVIAVTLVWSWLKKKKPEWAELVGSKVDLFRRIFEMVELLAPKLGLKEAEKLRFYLERIREWAEVLGIELSTNDYARAQLLAEEWAAEAKRMPLDQIGDTLRRLRDDAERVADNLEGLGRGGA